MAGGWGNQERAQFLFSSWSPASRNLPQVALEFKEHRRVSPFFIPPCLRVPMQAQRGQQPWESCQLQPGQAGRQLPGPPKPRSRSYSDTCKALVLGSITVPKRLQSPHPAAGPRLSPPHCLLPTQLLEASSAPCPGEAEHNQKEPGLTSAASQPPGNGGIFTHRIQKRGPDPVILVKAISPSPQRQPGWQMLKGSGSKAAGPP